MISISLLYATHPAICIEPATKAKNSSYLEEEVAPQILSLGTKPFVIFTDALIAVDAYF